MPELQEQCYAAAVDVIRGARRTEAAMQQLAATAGAEDRRAARELALSVGNTVEMVVLSAREGEVPNFALAAGHVRGSLRLGDHGAWRPGNRRGTPPSGAIRVKPTSPPPAASQPGVEPAGSSPRSWTRPTST